VVRHVRGVALIGRGGHEAEDCVKGEGADEGEAIDIAEVDFAAEEEEGAEEEEEEDGAGEVGVVHDVLVDAGEGVENCEGLGVLLDWLALGFFGRGSVCVSQILHMGPPRSGDTKADAYLDLNMPKIHPQLLQQRRFPLIPLRPKGCQPPRSQAPLFPHPPAHARGRCSAEASVGAALGCWGSIGGRVGILGLSRGAVAGDGGAGVLRGVELKVGRVVGGLWGGLGVVLCHRRWERESWVKEGNWGSPR